MFEVLSGVLKFCSVWRPGTAVHSPPPPQPCPKLDDGTEACARPRPLALPQVGLAGPSGSGKTAFSEKVRTFMPGECSHGVRLAGRRGGGHRGEQRRWGRASSVEQAVSNFWRVRRRGQSVLQVWPPID